jgi:predicted TIM-barrel fold metal-dependent hydrolase
MAAPHRIDVHHHIVPPRWLKEEQERMAGVAIGWKTVAEWTPEKSIEAMDKNGVATTVTSVSTMIVRPDAPDHMASLARDCNEFAARIAGDHKGRFGTFALLPLPHVDACLKEIEYCADVLKVDGFKMQTNYETQWPGDAAFAPVFDELNRRKAAVFFHPHVAGCCKGLLPGINEPLMEYPFDTTRAIASLMFSGTFARCPDVKFIFAHGGGTMAFLANRIGGLIRGRAELAQKFPGGILPVLRGLNFDVVSVTNEIAWAALLKFTSPQKLLFGTDIPYMTMEDTVRELGLMGLSAADLRAVERDNALKLMPSLPALATA